MIHFRAVAVAAGLGLAGLLLAAPQPAEAGSRHFSLSAPGFGIHISKGHGRRHWRGHRRNRHHYKRRHYRSVPFYGYYAPAPRHYYYAPRRYGRCHYKARRCAARWGWHTRNYYGCMRYYGCR
jgi:hypothetical protein